MAKKKAPIELAVPGRQQVRDMVKAGQHPNGTVILEQMFATLLGSQTAGVAMAEKILKRVKSRVTGVLGAGAMGVAFQLENGRVLKLTRDHDELEAAQVLMSKRHPNVIRFYDVFIARNGLGTGIVVRGSVDQNVAQLARTMPDFLDLAKALNKATEMATAFQPGWPDQFRITRKSLHEGMKVYLEELVSAYRSLTFPAPRSTATMQVLADTIAGVGFLLKCGVYGFDFHAGNIGVVASEVGERRGVVYDIGITSSRARKGIDTERVTLEDIMPVFGRMVKEAGRNPIPTVRV